MFCIDLENYNNYRYKCLISITGKLLASSCFSRKYVYVYTQKGGSCMSCHNLSVKDLNVTLQKWYHCLRAIPGKSKDTLYERIMTYLQRVRKWSHEANRCF